LLWWERGEKWDVGGVGSGGKRIDQRNRKEKKKEKKKKTSRQVLK